MDNVRPRTSSFSPSTKSSTTRTPLRPQRPKKIMKSIWVKKESTVGSQTVLLKIVQNKLRHKVKTIRCDHGTEFKNQLMNEFCAKKGIKREYSIARTPQQNGVAERKNRTLIEAARTMLADSLLPIQFWAEAVNTAQS
ncbi:putative ribonuclease H-like domain-containing protein [Tanacetum coccineum]